ncbi:fungal-specific transcription factor domain-containing protein [Aspergillus avenaceus]|uniref:Fungal-specific transcription factor domain-containing protein n=1 Tax=Aspergillus avenaceus TaxID=36643 RepID=A0A5N6U6K0_ASPAV|nr:fungal-specific transcription factor domain-containing protein [Aspergillus avenaceus]
MPAAKSAANGGRPYRSHLHPACFSCRKRKSRCRTKSPTEVCMMCQAHGTECIFPRPDDLYRGPQRRSPANLRPRKWILPRPDPAASHPSTQNERRPEVSVAFSKSSPNQDGNRMDESLPNLMGFVAEVGDDSSHIVSPAVVDDNDILESYISAVPTTQRCLIRTNPTLKRSQRPVRFNLVPRRPLKVTANQSLAASKCEIIEKYIDPDIDEFLNLFFLKANHCFPICDEASFRGTYSTHKEKISPALLCNLYAHSLVYWGSSARMCSGRIPDIRFIWNQANEALHSELFLSPGISTVLSIIINVCGRPSTSMFGNGGMVGTAVALSNALGLNRDPSIWNISPLEKRLRIRIWWLVVIHDRWCSLAYGTPLQVHRAQYDVPFPTVDDLSSLTDDVRRIVLRGTNLDIPGAANFRLAYLAVKMLLRRIQLNLNRSAPHVEDDNASPYYSYAQSAAEDIVYLVQELREPHLHGFWIPAHAFSLTSATMFLLRCGLRRTDQNRNTPLKIARDMIDTLRAHRRDFDWDLADNCLECCGELVERISDTSLDGEGLGSDLQDIEGDFTFDLDSIGLEEFFFGGDGVFDVSGFLNSV